MNLLRSNRFMREAEPLLTPPADLFSGLVAQSPDGMLAVGTDGRILSANPEADRMFGRPPERLRGMLLRDLLVADGAQRVTSSADGVPESEGYEARFVRADGTKRIAAVASAPLHVVTETGELQGIVVTIRDVTDERLAALELARSEARYRHLFEGASDAIMTFDALGRFTTVNDAGEAISGYPRAELIGRFFGPLLAIEALPKAILQFRRALSGNAGQFETVIVRKDGERRYATVNYACPQRSREVICMIRDATEEKQLQQQLIESEKMAAIGQLVSGVAHEINNPLASISGFAQLLLATPGLAPDVRHSAEVINGESRRAARIVHNLLTFARQHKAEKVCADINKVVEDTLELRSYEVNARGIRLVKELDRHRPETVVDVYQLQQVLLNLITNAEQAMGEIDRAEHRLTVRTCVLPETIRIEIEDTGTGIPEASLDLIFIPFFTTKPTGKGTGLGLSVSLGIVTEHGGRVWADNVPGGGTRFSVELPRVNAAAVRAVIAPAGAVAPRPALRVLVADDEEPIRLALEKFLTREGHTVVTVSCGSEALWRAEGDEIFDAIILDMRMPDVSGKQIFERWRLEREELSNRVVFLTGDIVSPDLQSFLSSTGRPFLPKPFEFDDILHALPRHRLG